MNFALGNQITCVFLQTWECLINSLCELTQSKQKNNMNVTEIHWNVAVHI